MAVAKWRDDGTDQAIHDLLRWHAREQKGRRADPTLVVLDTQSVHAAASVPAETTGKDPANYAGLPVMQGGARALVQCRGAGAIGIRLLDQAKNAHPTISKAWADTGFKNAAVEHGATIGIGVEVVPRNIQTRGFHVLKRRWVVERSLGWLMLHRRLARYYETLDGGGWR